MTVEEFFDQVITVRMRAVSYTHLDVYKRQAKAHHKEALKPLKGRSKQNQSDKVS